MSVCLDAFAPLAWLQDEPGTTITEGFLIQAASEQDFQCFVSAINVGEVYYRLYRIQEAAEADTFWDKAQHGLLPLAVINPTPQRITRRHD